MLHHIARKDFFRASEFADLFIAAMQQSYSVDLDGNFHLDFQEINRNKILSAAAEAGFVSGGIELCHKYSTCYL